MILLGYSDKGTPFIDLEEYGRLTFSRLTAHKTKGYKFICFHRVFEDEYTAKRKKKNDDGEIEVITYPVKCKGRDSYTFDMNFERKVGQQGQTKGIPRGTIPPRLGDWFRKILKKYITEDKYFPYEKMEKFQKYLTKQSIERILAKPQRKRKCKKKSEKNQ